MLRSGPACPANKGGTAMAPDRMLIIPRATPLSAYYRETDTHGESIPIYLMGVLFRSLERNRESTSLIRCRGTRCSTNRSNPPFCCCTALCVGSTATLPQNRLARLPRGTTQL